MNFSKELLAQLAEDPVAVLNRGRGVKETIELLRERIESWRQIAESITVNPQNTSGGSGPNDKIANCVASIMELEGEIASQIQKLVDLEKETDAIIATFVSDLKGARILVLRYLRGLRWDLVSARSGYTSRWAHTLHDKAIKEIKESALIHKESILFSEEMR